MHVVHLRGGQDAKRIVAEIKERFEKIYKSISSIEAHIDEDDVLVYSLRVHFNSLWEENSLEKINRSLSGGDPIQFIEEFTHTLKSSFDYLAAFFGDDERENFSIHSLVALKGISLSLPFVVKAYDFGLSSEEIGRLCGAMASLILRHRLIGTRAEITSRINEVFQSFTKEEPSIEPIISRVEKLKTSSDEWWWAYWNNDNLRAAVRGGVDHSIAKYVLWRYENYLESQGKSGYNPSRYERIDRPELEHIAPTTESAVVAHGYDYYDEVFTTQYLNCFGNYLLLSKSHNCALGNKPFSEKLETYTHNEQQREIKTFITGSGIWDRNAIEKRQDKIVDFVIFNI